MEATTTSETTFRAVLIDPYGRSLCQVRGTADEAWADADARTDMMFSGQKEDSRWIVEKTTITTTTTEVAR